MKNKKYSSDTWIDPRVEVRESRTHGKGLFAREPIVGGEVVVVWGGTLMRKDEIRIGRYKKGTAVEIGEGLYLAAKPGDKRESGDYLNHSCDPNLWLKDEVTLIARRDIEKDEEVTADYGTWVSRPEWKIGCKCGSELCRKAITGSDWKRKEMRARYRGHFSPYLEKGIEKLHEE